MKMHCKRIDYIIHDWLSYKKYQLSNDIFSLQPYVHVQIDGRTDVSDGPLIRTDVALFPDMTLYDAIAEASVRFGVEHPCVQNPYRMEVASASSNCYTVINVPGVVSSTNSRWIIQIVRRRGRVRTLLIMPIPC